MASLKSTSAADTVPNAGPVSDSPGAVNAEEPWVLVAGGFHRNGGMDKANLALAQYLVEQGVPVHVVCHSVDPELARHPLVTVHTVSKPIGSYFLGRPLMDLQGRRVARRVMRRWPRATVVVNGGNCLWPGVNWVHYVHHAWKPKTAEGPFWFRVKQALNRWLDRKREKSMARAGQVFLTNSSRTSRDIIDHLGVDPRRVHTVYLGGEAEWGPVTLREKAAARESLQISEAKPVAIFIGSLGFDHRKGFDTLLEAWRKLCANPSWDVELFVAGNGNALTMYRERISQYKLEHRIHMLGFSTRVPQLLAAADVLVSPVRYEAYGLNVQEAICRGVPAIVSAGAGVAERYGPEFAALLLPDPENVDDLVERLLGWRSNMHEWEARFQRLGADLRQYSWKDMACQMVSMANQTREIPAAPDRKLDAAR